MGFGWSNGVCLEFLDQYGQEVVADHNQTTLGAATGIGSNMAQIWSLLVLALIASLLLYY